MTSILATLLLSFLIILLVIAGMSVGVMNGRKAISGSCGGLNSGGCKLCSGSCRDRATESEEQ